MNPISRRVFNSNLATILSSVAVNSFVSSDSVSAVKSKSLLRDRLFVMSPWFYKYPLSAKQTAKLLNDIGCPRIGHSLGNADDERWKTFEDLLIGLDEGKCELVSVYAGLSIDDSKVPACIIDLFKKLKGRNTFIWLNLYSRKFKPSDPAGDEFAVELIKHASDAAGRFGLQISLYPHFNNWLERTEDAFRVAEKVDRKNVGCTFNLYHWLKVEGSENLKTKAEKVIPKLNALTINGSLKNASDLQVVEGIKPLGEGDYDVEEFVRTFIELGYNGPIGLQGYGIEGDIPTLLEQSLNEWDSMCERI